MEKEVEGEKRMSRSGWLSGLLSRLRNRLNQTWPGCNEGEGPGCATAWVNSDCFSPGFPNTGNNGTIVPPALIKRRTRDGARSRSGEGRWVKKGQKGRRGVKRRGVGERRSEWEPDRNRGWGGRGKWRKKRGMEGDGERCFSDLHCVFFSLHLPPVSTSLYLLSHHLSSFSSHPFIHTSVPHPPTSHLLPIPSICPLFHFVFAFGMARDALPVIPPLHHLSHPVREREGQRGEERERKRGLGGGMREAGQRKGAGARQKEKITPLPGLMNMGKG